MGKIYQGSGRLKRQKYRNMRDEHENLTCLYKHSVSLKPTMTVRTPRSQPAHLTVQLTKQLNDYWRVSNQKYFYFLSKGYT